MTNDRAKEIFERLFGVCEGGDNWGFRLAFKPTKSGIIVSKWYSRNVWVDDTLEKQVLLSNGKIYENKKEIGTYNETQQNLI